MTSKVDIEIRRGDTRPHIFHVKNSLGGSVDLSGWSGFAMAVSTEKAPVDTAKQQALLAGELLTDGTDGRVVFPVSPDINAGAFYYDAQGVDDAGYIVTIAAGKYRVVQDITKV